MPQPITRFAPPAYVRDLPEATLAQWSDEVRGWFDKAKDYLREKVDAADVRLFHLLEAPGMQAGPAAEIPWSGFPRKFTILWPNDPERRWKYADGVYTADLNGRRPPYYYRAGGKWRPATDLSFRDQDEYCEWRVIKDPGTAEVTRIVFACENPEYWKFVAAKDPQKLVALYKELVSAAVTLEDLLFAKDTFSRDTDAGGNPVMVNRKGTYNPYNKWNTTDGIVHLTHPANSLEAEVYLAADATILRKDQNGAPITEDNALICAAGYGGPNRSSDPTIGSRVNGLVRNSLAITIDDPVGLYIHGLDASGIEVPGGAVDDWWRVIRGDRDKHMILRAEFAPPAGSGLKLTDVVVGGEPLRYGAQIAELITMAIYGRGYAAPPPNPYVGVCHCCHDPTLPRLQTIEDIGTPCPPAAVAPASHPFAVAADVVPARPAPAPVEPTEIPPQNKRA